jgi:hypothetical protein
MKRTTGCAWAVGGSQVDAATCLRPIMTTHAGDLARLSHFGMPPGPGALARRTTRPGRSR